VFVCVCVRERERERERESERERERERERVAAVAVFTTVFTTALYLCTSGARQRWGERCNEGREEIGG